MKTTKQIKSIATRLGFTQKVLDKEWRELLIDALENASVSGDHTGLSFVVGQFGKSQKRNSVIKWVGDHSPLNWNEENKAFSKPKKTKREYNFEVARKHNPFTYGKGVKENQEGNWNFDNALAAFIKTAEKHGISHNEIVNKLKEVA